MFLSRLWPEGHRAASTSGDPGPSPGPRPCSLRVWHAGGGAPPDAPFCALCPRAGQHPAPQAPGAWRHQSRARPSRISSAGCRSLPRGAVCSGPWGQQGPAARGHGQSSPRRRPGARCTDFRGAATGNPPQASSRGAGDQGDAGTPHCDEPVQDDGCSRSCLNHVNWARTRLRGKTASGMRACGGRLRGGGAADRPGVPGPRGEARRPL